MDTVYLHWNVTNWITVVLMAALGFMILSLGAQFWKNRQA
jgi:hypothetical protein